MRYPRQNKILELIYKYDISTQDDLVKLLLEEGFDVTQATVSRDIRELQLVKVQDASGKYKYAESDRDDGPISSRFTNIFKDTIQGFEVAGNLIVVRTLTGCAHAAGQSIDNLNLEHIVGTIAGSNNLLLIVDHEDNVDIILEYLNSVMLSRGHIY